MTKEQALKVLGEVCAKFMGNLADHQAIQQALAKVNSLVEPTPDSKPESQEAK